MSIITRCMAALKFDAFEINRSIKLHKVISGIFIVSAHKVLKEYCIGTYPTWV